MQSIEEDRVQSEESDSEDDFGPQPPNEPEEQAIPDPSANAKAHGSSIDEYAVTNKIPISHQVEFSGHTRAVSCVSIEPTGNRVVSGSLDYNLKIYDFGGMDKRHRPFKSAEPQESTPITSLSHSPTGDKFLVTLSSVQPKIYDREGELLITFCRGDMYLLDLSNTKGHTMETTGGVWHPTNKQIVLTSSLDGTLRVWDLMGEALFGNLINKNVLKLRSAVGVQRVGALCCAYSPSGKKMIAGGIDGSIQIWNEKKLYTKPDILLRHCHSAVRSILAIDEIKIVSRGDEHLKVWDTKNVKAAPVTLECARNVYDMANIELSPDKRYICCGTSNPSKDASAANNAALVFYDISVATPSPSAVLAIHIGNCNSVICVKWHAKTNHIYCTTSSGVTKVFYDPNFSSKGAILTAGRAPKREKDPSDFCAVGEIYLPNALPMYKAENPEDARRLKGKIRKDPIRSKIPDRPSSTKLNATNTSFFFTQYVTEGKKQDMSFREDPRDALLKMDAVASKDPIFFGNAYKDTQPKKLYADTSAEQEQEEFKKRQRKA